MPPYLAGRGKEEDEFRRLLDQDAILDNMILTGLRGVGKTVLLERFKPVAQDAGWLWASTDLSESASINEDRIARRMLTDLSPLTSSLTAKREEIGTMILGGASKTVEHKLDYSFLQRVYDETPGLVVDKLKAAFQIAWSHLETAGKRGVVFAYDEAQTMADHANKEEYPLAVMLEVFQSIQKRGIPFLLVLTGLPTLFAKLVESRTYSERMFHIVFLNRLNDEDSRAAILKPLNKSQITLSESSVETIVEVSGGYPYFIQFICREVFDLFLAGMESVPVQEIVSKLDADFFSGRWQRLSDRQRALMTVAASLPTAEGEFTVQELTDASRRRDDMKPFTASHANQILSALCDKGLVFKNRHGKYLFAVPLLDRFIQRQEAGPYGEAARDD